MILELFEISCEHDFSISELHTLNPALKEFGLQRQSPNAFDLAITTGVIKSGCARTVGSQRPEDYLIQEFRMSKSVARKHRNVAGELEKSEEAEKTAFKALRRGYLNVESLDRIIQECNELAPEAAASKLEILQSACKQSGMLGSTGAVREVRRLVRKANSKFPTNPDIAFQNRKLTIGKQDSNGGARITGYLDAATLALFDGCCQYPECGMPMPKCDMHHIEAWSRGGATDIENLTLICRYHHSLNDDSQSTPECGHMSERLPENMWKSGWIAPTTKTGVSNKDGAECPSIEFNHSFAATNAPVATLGRTETLPR